MINGRNFFDQSIKKYLNTYHNIWKIATDQGDDYATGCLPDYPYFKKYYKLIAIDLSKQQKLDADLKEIQQFYRKSRESRIRNNVFRYWKSKTNSFRFFERDS